MNDYQYVADRFDDAQYAHNLRCERARSIPYSFRIHFVNVKEVEEAGYELDSCCDERFTEAEREALSDITFIRQVEP